MAINFTQAKRIMSLDIGLLMAGAKERGALEARVTGLISEVQKAGHLPKCFLDLAQYATFFLFNSNLLAQMQVMLFCLSTKFTHLLGLAQLEGETMDLVLIFPIY